MEIDIQSSVLGADFVLAVRLDGRLRVIFDWVEGFFWIPRLVAFGGGGIWRGWLD